VLKKLKELAVATTADRPRRAQLFPVELDRLVAVIVMSDEKERWPR
jgi:hypothetical protein